MIKCKLINSIRMLIFQIRYLEIPLDHFEATKDLINLCIVIFYYSSYPKDDFESFRNLYKGASFFPFTSLNEKNQSCDRKKAMGCKLTAFEAVERLHRNSAYNCSEFLRKYTR